MRRTSVRMKSALATTAAVVGMTTTAFFFTAPDVSGQQETLPEQPSLIGAELADGEDRRTWQYLVDYRNFSRGPLSTDPDEPPSRGHMSFQLVVDNALPMVEVAISLDGPKCPFPVLFVEERLTGHPKRQTTEPGPFRRLYVAADDQIWFTVQGQATPTDAYVLDPGRDVRAYECILTIELRRIYDRCVVSATVSGDVSGSFFGEVAYFNTYDQPVAVPLDPGQLELLDSLLGMATPQPTDPEKPGSQPAQPSFSDALAAWAAEDSEVSPMSGRFNLTAANVLFSDDAVGGSGMFSFSAVGPGVVEPGEAITVPLSYVAALPGAMDANFGGGKFLWSEGQPGSATLYVVGARENTLVGTLDATLFTERAYDPPGRRLQIRLKANFLAQRGALRCQ